MYQEFETEPSHNTQNEVIVDGLPVEAAAASPPADNASTTAAQHSPRLLLFLFALSASMVLSSREIDRATDRHHRRPVHRRRRPIHT